MDAHAASLTWCLQALGVDILDVVEHIPEVGQLYVVAINTAVVHQLAVVDHTAVVHKLTVVHQLAVVYQLAVIHQLNVVDQTTLVDQLAVVVDVVLGDDGRLKELGNVESDAEDDDWQDVTENTEPDAAPEVDIAVGDGEANCHISVKTKTFKTKSPGS